MKKKNIIQGCLEINYTRCYGLQRAAKMVMIEQKLNNGVVVMVLLALVYL